MMKTILWAQFTWDLAKTAPGRPALPPSFSIRRATPGDEEAIRSVTMSAFTLDSEWHSFFFLVRPMFETALEEIFSQDDDPLCLVVSHGPRIIGASGLSVERDACSHLLTGPCLSLEYRNRGIASAMLAHSLSFLREGGVTTARGITKEGTTAAQFIYPKFGSTHAPAPEALIAELRKRRSESPKNRG
jgi:hypothetical protein